MLKEADDHISGQQLCEQFQVSRTAVWKADQSAERRGLSGGSGAEQRLPDHRKPGRTGCKRRTGGADWRCDPLGGAGDRLFLRKRIRPMSGQGSWEKTARRTERLSLRNSRLCRERTPGQRMGNRPRDSSVYMSLLLRPEFLPNKAPMLTIVMAYSVATALREQTGLDFRIKMAQRHCAEREKSGRGT